MGDLFRCDIRDIDLNKPLLRSNVGVVLATGDKLANRFGVNVYRQNVAVDLAGRACVGYFIRPNTETVVLSGKVQGNTAYVDLKQACYISEGSFTLAIKVSGTDVIHTVRIVDGYIKLTQTDELIDPGAAVPTLDDIFAQIAAMKTATERATEAAEGAEVFVTDLEEPYTKTDPRAREHGFLTNLNRASYWVQGALQGDGSIVPDGHVYYPIRVSTKVSFSKDDVSIIHADAPYQVNIFQFDANGGFVGETGNHYNIRTSELADICTRFMIQIRNGDDTSAAITPDVYKNVLILKDEDESFPYERGDISASTGENVDPVNDAQGWAIFRTKGFVSTEQIANMQIAAGYRLGLYVYDKETSEFLDYHVINENTGFVFSDAYKYRLCFFDNDNGAIMYSAVANYGINQYKGSQTWTNLQSNWQNGYIGGSGEVLTTTDLYRNKNIVTKSFISRTVKIIKCDSPYVARYHQYDAEGNYIGESDVSRLLVIPDQNCRYRIQVRNAYGTDGPDIDPSVIESVDFVEGVFTTKYGRAAYFAPFAGVNGYYPGYQTDYGRFNRETTTKQLYDALDEVISASGGYITKTVLDKCSDGEHWLIRLDCVEDGVDAERTNRTNKPKIVIVCAQHGGEKCSSYSMYYLLKDLCENWQRDGILEYIRYNCHLIILPVANPFGFDVVQYHNANDVNLNRNYVYNWDGTGNGGSGPLSEPETQTIAALVRKERSAIYIADYHCNGDSTTLPEGAKPNWHSQLQTYDAVHDSIGTASKTHIDNISRHWWNEYSDFLKKEIDGSCGSVDTGYWETGLPTLQGYASRNGIVANTFEGLNGFTDREGFGAEGAEACTKLIGNWIMAVLMHYAKYFDISNFE